jgi:hypothetical protein
MSTKPLTSTDRFSRWRQEPAACSFRSREQESGSSAWTGRGRCSIVAERKVAAEPAAVRDRITLHDADMRDFDVRERFAAAILPFRPVQHLTSIDDQLSCLDAIRRHLLPGGRLIFDVFNPDLKRIASPSTDEFEDTPDTPLPDGSVFRRAGR